MGRTEARIEVILVSVTSILIAGASLSVGIMRAALRDIANPFSMFDTIWSGAQLAQVFAVFLFFDLLAETLLLLAALRTLTMRKDALTWLSRALVARTLTTAGMAWGHYASEIRPYLAELDAPVPLAWAIRPVLPQLATVPLSLLALWSARHASRADARAAPMKDGKT